MHFITASIAVILACFLAPRPAEAGPALLFDPSNGQVLYAEDQDNQWHPASLTKIMTAYLTFEALKAGKLTLETKITCSEAASAQAPSKVGLPIGAELTVDLALQAVIIKSANDVSVMLAEAVGGSEPLFVAQMNETAKRLGMDRTNFVNANGLPASGQVTTARDLAKLARAVLRDFPEHAHYWSMTDMRLGKRRLGTHNSLLTSFQGADGMKTGFICDSGFNVVASATRDGRRLMAIVLGAPTGHDRKLKAAGMLEHGFQSYDWKQLFTPASIDSLPVPADAKSVMTMRGEVISWECGTGRRVARAKKVRQARTKTAKGRSGKKKAEIPPGSPAATGKSAEARVNASSSAKAP